MQKIIARDQLIKCAGLTRKEAAETLRIDLSKLWREACRYELNHIFKPMKKPCLTREIIEEHIGMSAYSISKELGYRPETVYNAIRRFGLQKQFGLAHYSAGYQG